MKKSIILILICMILIIVISGCNTSRYTDCSSICGCHIVYVYFEDEINRSIAFERIICERGFDNIYVSEEMCEKIDGKIKLISKSSCNIK